MYWGLLTIKLSEKRFCKIQQQRCNAKALFACKNDPRSYLSQTIKEEFPKHINHVGSYTSGYRGARVHATMVSGGGQFKQCNIVSAAPTHRGTLDGFRVNMCGFLIRATIRPDSSKGLIRFNVTMIVAILT